MGRPRKKPPVDSDSPPPALVTPESERETIANWFRQRLEQSEREHAERINTLRTVGEHPSPVFARQARMFGMLGLPRDLSAKMLQLSAHMFDVHYEEDYKLGTAEVISSVAANAIRIGTSTTDPAAAKTAMDILARRGGPEWKPPAQQVKMEDDREKKPSVIDTSGWPLEKRQALEAMLREEIGTGSVTGNGVAGMLERDEEDSGMAE
jgi:hypothetical protein